MIYARLLHIQTINNLHISNYFLIIISSTYVQLINVHVLNKNIPAVWVCTDYSIFDVCGVWFYLKIVFGIFIKHLILNGLDFSSLVLNVNRLFHCQGISYFINLCKYYFYHNISIINYTNIHKVPLKNGDLKMVINF